MKTEDIVCSHHRAAAEIARKRRCGSRGARAESGNGLLDRSSSPPYLVLGVRGEELQRADGEPELIRVRELPHADAERDELVPRHARRAFHDILPHVVDALRYDREHAMGEEGEDG